MKKIGLLLVFILIFCLTGCNKDINEQSTNSFLNVQANSADKIIIDTKYISNNATFVNYDIDDVTIQFIVVRGTDNVVRIVFNTCGACNPSSTAYFKQVGEYLECQTCGNQFHIDEIGISKVGCNPIPVEEKEESNNQIIIDKTYVDSFKEKFENWDGQIS